MLADPVLNETYLQSPDSAEDDIDIKSKNEKIKFTKLMSHSKYIYYILHVGKNKTPLHIMLSME